MKQTASPVISFLIPLYNCGKTIEKCVGSITSQFEGDYPYEIVVVNDGSTDNGTEILNNLITRVRDKHIAEFKESYMRRISGGQTMVA